MNHDERFTRVVYKPDKFEPEVWHRELEQVKVGTRFGGLVTVYKTQYTEWKKELPRGEK